MAGMALLQTPCYANTLIKVLTAACLRCSLSCDERKVTTLCARAAQVTLCDQLESYMSRFAVDNGTKPDAAGNGVAKAVQEGFRPAKKDDLDDKYGGTGGKKASLLSPGLAGIHVVHRVWTSTKYRE